MATMNQPKKQKNDPIADELEAIKRLLILQLVAQGVRVTDIASALGVHKSTVSRLVSTRRMKLPSEK